MTQKLRKYADVRSWLRHLARSSIHAGVSAVLSGMGTNALESWAPTAFANVGLDLRQMGAVFVGAAFWEALRRIQAATADSEPPFPSNPHQPAP